MALLVLRTMMNSIRVYLQAQAKRIKEENIDTTDSVNMARVPALLDKVVSAKFLLYTGIRVDVLEPLIFFIKVSQAVDMDIMSYIEEATRVRGKLEALTMSENGGPQFRAMVKVLLTPGNKYETWPGVKKFREDPNLQIRYKGYARDAADSFLSNFLKQFPEEQMEWMDMYRLLSMNSFRLKVKEEAQLHAFGEECYTKIKEFFSKEFHYFCTWPEEKGRHIRSAALFTMEQFKQVITTTRLSGRQYCEAITALGRLVGCRFLNFYPNSACAFYIMFFS